MTPSIGISSPIAKKHELGCEFMRICVIYRISKKNKKYQIYPITKAGENIVSS